MNARAGATRRAAVGFIWLSLLLLTIPAVGTTWSIGGAPFSASLLLAQPLGLVYLGFCTIIALAFATRCRSRRIVLLLHAVVLFALHAATDAFALAQILSALAALAILCSLANWAKRRAESTYGSFRRGAEARFANAVARRADLGVLSAHEQLDLAREELHENVEASRAWAHQSVDALFAFTATVSAVLTIWLVMVAIKSYLYVLALEIFHETGVSYVGFDRALAIQGRYEAQDGIEVSKAFTTPLLTFEVGVNQRKDIVLWKPWIAFLHRLLHWKWQMSRGSHSRQGHMHFPSGQGSIGVKWTMAPGEEVIIAFPNLLGFSENVAITSIVSLRLSTILFGRYIFHSARCTHGEGLLLLSVPDNAVLADEDVHEVPLGRIKAFNRHARFRVSSERSWRAVFKDGFNLSRVDGDAASRGLVLVGSSTEGELRFQGLVRFAKTFMWPL